MQNNLIARSSVTVDASPDVVWGALVDPKAIKQYMFGTNVSSSWAKGDPITWEGEYEGKKYKDKGEILELEPNHLLKYSHFGPLSGDEDKPENYHTVTIALAADGDRTSVTLTQDNNPSEKAREHSEKNWDTMLSGLKKYIEH